MNVLFLSNVFIDVVRARDSSEGPEQDVQDTENENSECCNYCTC